MLRCLPALVVLMLAACAPRARAPDTPADEPAPERVTPPGGPHVASLPTDRAHVVRLAAPAPAAPPPGREVPPAILVVAAAVPGVSVSIDGGAGRPPPFELEVAPGAHRLEARCPGGSTDSRQPVVAAGATVRVRVCSATPPPP